jgi:hypothetical protein
VIRFVNVVGQAHSLFSILLPYLSHRIALLWAVLTALVAPFADEMMNTAKRVRLYFRAYRL